MESVEGETLLRGQAQVWQLMFGFADSMSLKSAVELRIPDIIHSHAAPISLSKIASGIDSCHVDLAYLERIMRYLVRKQVFSANQQTNDGETLYGMTHISKWLLSNSELSLSPLVTTVNHPLHLASWHYLGECIKQTGSIPFKKAHGSELWEFASKNPEFNKSFNDAMACTAKITTKALLSHYKDGFSDVKSLVDVGGGTGGFLVEILRGFPHINGFNLDLPHVIAMAPQHAGISHVGGDMFEAIPKADAILMKRVLHDWGDEDCVKILKNCRKALPEKMGKLIVVEAVLQLDSINSNGSMGFAFDMAMFAYTTGGKERTELEWKKLLEEGGFTCYKIIKIPDMLSIIEAYTE
ncbi:desmethylxanthohumol 6'-O-methyltransferase-like [Tripterygium wilfordii]|uniref:desmethylxanthohumol 6'-O-methyltransferase-like n=1 Tax=Tripterygium wilfordii TaxID=458696 RepID=UPI0018F83B9D|nr:desmethylxanthohumol 6'-O-methyltransferase-like [Tripterygium wilfordii]